MPTNDERRGSSTRLTMVDALRGYALMGLFLVHMEEYYGLYWAHPHPTATTHLVFSLFTGKAFSLLALCFGYSFYIIMDAGRRGARPSPTLFAWRQVLLLLIGTLHGLIYRGDITVLLAVAGFLLIPANRISGNRVLVALAAACLLQPYMLAEIAGAYAGRHWAQVAPHYTHDPAMRSYLEGGFADVVRANAGAGRAQKWWFLLESGRCAQVIGLFLLGLVLGRIGFFSQPERFRRARAIALLASLAVILIIRAERPHLSALAEWPAYWTRTLLSGWTDLAEMAASVLLFIPVWQAGGDRVLKALAPVGRMTLTLYVGQSLLFVPLFYSFGLGLHAWITQPQALALGVVSFAAQMAFAARWFRSFHYGPLEWLWRCATRMSLDIPFRRTPRRSPEFAGLQPTSGG